MNATAIEESIRAQESSVCVCLTLHPSHSFLTELRTFIPRACCLSSAIGLGIDIASARLDCDCDCDTAHSDGRCAVLERIFKVCAVVEKEVRALQRHWMARSDVNVRRVNILNMAAVASVTEGQTIYTSIEYCNCFLKASVMTCVRLSLGQCTGSIRHSAMKGDAVDH